MGDKMNIKFDAILIGESGVGKTSIINSYCSGKFKEDDIQKTNGCSYTNLKVIIDGNKYIPLDIWDTAGGQKYRILMKQFFKNIKNKTAFIFVYDITKKETFEELKNHWVNEIGAYAPKDKSKQKFF